MSDNIYSSRPDRLALLFALDERGRDIWRVDDLADILSHQLNAPLLFDTAQLEVGGFAAGSLRSFGDLLRHPGPPLELLRLTKDFAKVSDRREEGPLPPEIATVLYYGVISVALVRHGQRITELDDAALIKGVSWVLAQIWIDPETRGLFEEARARLAAPKTG